MYLGLSSGLGSTVPGSLRGRVLPGPADDGGCPADLRKAIFFVVTVFPVDIGDL